MPMPAVMYPPILNEIRDGARLEKPLAGATMLAAMLVVSVAISSAPSASTTPSPPMRPASATGSQIASP